MFDVTEINLFAFDFDGTLVQSNAIKSNTFYEVTSHLSGSAALLDEIFATRPELDRYGILQLLAERVGGEVDHVALTETYTRRVEANILAAPEVPGTATMLQKLADTGRAAVVNSATPEAPLRKVVPQISFGGLIAATYGQPTSKEENLQKAMSKFDASPEQTVMVGDREADRISAVNTGCGFIGIASDLTDFEQTPDVILEDYSPLTARLG